MVPTVTVLSLLIASVALCIAVHASSVSRHALRLALDDRRWNALRALGDAAVAVQVAAHAYVSATSAGESGVVARRRVAACAREYVLASRSLAHIAMRVAPGVLCRPWLLLLCDERHPEAVVRTEAADGLLAVLRRMEAEACHPIPSTRGSVVWRWRARFGLARLAMRTRLRTSSQG